MKTFLYGLIALVLSIGVGLIGYQLLVKQPTDTGVSIDSVCGNGVQEAGEQCDDGNLTSNDGCSSICEVEETDSSACDPITESVTVTIPALRGGKCSWSQKKRKTVSGFNTSSVTVQVPNNICGFSTNSITTGTQNVRYDDEFLVTLENYILMSSMRSMYDAYPSDGLLKTYTGFSPILGIVGSGGHDPICAGGILGSASSSTCRVPSTETRGSFMISIPENVGEQLAQRISGLDSLTFQSVAVGDDDTSIDCALSALSFTVSFEIAPEGCSCGFEEPVCGNGIQELGEECDGDGADFTCTSNCEAVYQCNDGLDNDGDGLIDCTPGAEDPGCFPDGRGGGGECQPRDNDETNPVCGNGVVEDGEYCDEGASNSDTHATCNTQCYFNNVCNDGLDNDGDGFIDCTAGAEDPGCFPDGRGGGGQCDPDDDTEEDAPLTCGDGIVDDGEECDDGNVIDSGDICANDCTLNPECSDGLDNDGDGFIDCTAGAEDPGCFPNGNGGGGACNPLDDNETDLVVAPVGVIPDTAFGDQSSHYLLLGFLLIVTGGLFYRTGVLNRIFKFGPHTRGEYEEMALTDSEKKVK